MHAIAVSADRHTWAHGRNCRIHHASLASILRITPELATLRIGIVIASTTML
jgi:hypothetical protein